MQMLSIIEVYNLLCRFSLSGTFISVSGFYLIMLECLFANMSKFWFSL